MAPAIVVLLGLLADPASGPESLRVWWNEVKARVRGASATPVVWGAAAAVAIGLGVAALVLMRSGNEAAIAPSGVELQMRQMLENLLIARPRTKEFLFGHPALMLAMALGWRGRRTWLPFAALVAAIGQASVLNTFCHFHEPLYLGLLRTVHGLWIGGLIGAAVMLIWLRAFVRPSRVTSA